MTQTKQIQKKKEESMFKMSFEVSGLTLEVAGATKKLKAFLKVFEKLAPQLEKELQTSVNSSDILEGTIATEVGDKILFECEGYNSRKIDRAIVEGGEALFEKNPDVDMVFVPVNGVGSKTYPVGRNLIQAKNNAGL